MNKCFVSSIVVFVITLVSRSCLTFFTLICQCWRQHWVYALVDRDFFVMAMKGRQWLSKMALYIHVPREGKGQNYQKRTLSRRRKEWRVQTTVKIMICGTTEHRIAWCHCISAKDMPNMYLSVSSSSRTDLAI